jgi:hypothetical protein
MRSDHSFRHPAAAVPASALATIQRFGGGGTGEFLAANAIASAAAI